VDTAILFPDAQLAGRDLLRRLLAGRTEPVVRNVTVSTRGPDDNDDKPALPYIQVVVDGTYRDSRLNGRATLRVIVWHTDEGLGQRLALLCEALLLASSSDDIRGFSPLVGPIPTGDPDTQEPMSYFTLTARLRPKNL